MQRKRVGWWGIGVVVCVMSCGGERSPTGLSSVPNPSIESPRRSIYTPVVPGVCRSTHGAGAVSPSQSIGSITDEATGCTIPDSMWTRITVKGLMTASPNPVHQQYFPPTSYDASGQYGPLGRPTQELLVKIKLQYSNTITVKGRNRSSRQMLLPPRSQINSVVKSTKRGQTCFL